MGAAGKTRGLGSPTPTGGWRARVARLPLLRRLAGHDEGAVLAEAVIMLPVLILLWAIIIYLHMAFRGGMMNLAQARDHAWSHAVSACEWSAPSPTEISPSDTVDGEDSMSSPLSFILMSGFIPGFQIDEKYTQRRDSLERPRHIGGGTKTYEWHLYLLCNEPQRDPGDTPFWEAWLGWGL